MLSARVAPSFVKYAQLRYAAYQPALMQSIATIQLSTCSTGAEPNRFASTGVDYAQNSRNSNFAITRSYTTKTPKLPSKSELEKIFFKVTVLIWDLACVVIRWAWSTFNNNVIQNPTVQSYWKIFNSKLDEARKK